MTTQQRMQKLNLDMRDVDKLVIMENDSQKEGALSIFDWTNSKGKAKDDNIDHSQDNSLLLKAPRYNININTIDFLILNILLL